MADDASPRGFGFRIGCGLTLVLLAIVAAVGGYVALQTVRSTTLDAADRLLAAAATGHVTQQFHNEFVKISATQRLTVAELTQTCTITRRDSRSVLWQTIPLGEVVVAARVPTTFGYYVDLERGPWQFAQRGGVLHVTCPPLEAAAPAAKVSEIEYLVQGSWLRRSDPVLEQVRASLDEQLARTARQNIPVIREFARRKVAEFVRTWAIGQYGVAAAEVPIAVRFADEPDTAPEDRPGPPPTP
jgi:hypothetical protein